MESLHSLLRTHWDHEPPLTRPSATLSPSDGEREGVRGRFMESVLAMTKASARSAVLRQQLPDYVAVDVSEPIIAAFEPIGQLLVVDAQQVEQGRVEVVHVDRVFHHVVAEVIGATEHEPRFSAAASHPE